MNSVWFDRGSLAAVHYEQKQTPHHCRQQDNGKSVPQAVEDKAQSGAGSSMAVPTSGTCPHGRDTPALRICKHRPQQPLRFLISTKLHVVVLRIWSTSNGDTRGSVVLWCLPHPAAANLHTILALVRGHQCEAKHGNPCSSL